MIVALIFGPLFILVGIAEIRSGETNKGMASIGIGLFIIFLPFILEFYSRP
jgi:hypothetical protein